MIIVNCMISKLNLSKMLDLGPSWLDNYVRIILSEACAGGLELGILKGTGKNQPIGMCKNLDGSVTQGEYADKTKVKLLSFDPVEYCAIIADLAKKPNEAGYRAVPSVAFICNPVDYIAKIVTVHRSLSLILLHQHLPVAGQGVRNLIIMQ